METPFPSFDPDGESARKAGGGRLRDIPVKSIFPNLLTLLAIASGLTSIRFSIENRIELAIAAIILAAILDGLDGRVARFFKSASRFGAQLDSLADFVNFGVAPALLLYFNLIDGFRSIGWIAALIYAICVCLRLARFNVMMDLPDRPSWQKQFFVGVPAPAAAMLVLAPVYVLLLGVARVPTFELLSAVYVVVVGLLTVSTLPTFAGKDFGRRIPRDRVLPLLLVAVGATAFLLSYPWQTLLGAVTAYYASLPFGWRAWRREEAGNAAPPSPPGAE